MKEKMGKSATRQITKIFTDAISDMKSDGSRKSKRKRKEEEQMALAMLSQMDKFDESGDGGLEDLGKLD